MVRSNVNRTLQDLGTTYVDLMLIHVPSPRKDINQLAWTSLAEEQKSQEKLFQVNSKGLVALCNPGKVIDFA